MGNNLFCEIYVLHTLCYYAKLVLVVFFHRFHKKIALKFHTRVVICRIRKTVNTFVHLEWAAAVRMKKTRCVMYCCTQCTQYKLWLWAIFNKGISTVCFLTADTCQLFSFSHTITLENWNNSLLALSFWLRIHGDFVPVYTLFLLLFLFFFLLAL